MEIDEKSIEVAKQLKASDSANGPRQSSREKWLSALEKESFDLSDDTLRQPGSDGFQRPPAEFTEASAPHEPAGIAALHQALGAGSVLRQAPAATPLPAAAPLPPSMAASPPPSPLVGSAAAGVARPGAAPSAGMVPSAPGHSQRYEALMSQTRFMEVNIQLTQSGGSVTLWIRDFKNKYANEVFHWTRSLETLLRERGQSLSRVMLNGKPIPSIEAVFGGEHGN